MKNIQGFILVLIIISGVCVPVMAASQEEDILGGVKNITVIVPTYQPAAIGSQESMIGYQSYLVDCAASLISLSNQVLVIFGQEKFAWNVPEKMGPVPASAPAPVTTAHTPAYVSPVSGSGNAISISNNAFSPTSIIVPAGSTVMWTNNDDHAHRIMFQNGQYSAFLMAPGQSSSQQFNHPGTYDYSCMLYPSMQGRITVI